MADVADNPAHDEVSSAIDQPLGAIYSLFRSIEAQGHEQRSRVLTLEQRTNAESADILGVDPADCLVIGDRDDADGVAARSAGMRFRKV